MSSELSKTYQPEEVEPQILNRWNDADAFHAVPNDPQRPDPYAIVIPPPNVTAALHMGHALNNTLQDILIRWRRMQGRNSMWMPGTDHAGIATQTVVEKRVLQAEGKRRTDFDRDEFVAKIQAWKDEYEERITEQLRVMGCSCDWERQRFTMDPVCAAAVREAFFRLFQDGLIYRGKRLVNWDPVTQTALADDEVEMQEIDGFFWYLRYPLVKPVEFDGKKIEFVTVATTRPETMLGDTAVAVNPNDPRAEALRGAKVKLPIVGRVIPIVEDDYVVLPDPESSDEKARFSSGFLKVTPAHDPNDWEIGQRFQLPVINVMAPDATISCDYGWPREEVESDILPALLGADRYSARVGIVNWFEEAGLLEGVKPYRHAVGHSYRSHVPVEPYLSDQWYVKVTDERLAGAALRAMAQDQRSESGGCVWRDGNESSKETSRAGGDWEGKLRFHPPRYAKVFQSWHENLRDWCISRQLWWGHRIPVWSTSEEANFDASKLGDRVAEQVIDGRRYVCVRRADDVEAVQTLTDAGFAQDDDVLDTWFSSGLWPISTLGWPNPEAFPESFPEGAAPLDNWNPSHTLCTAREIITLWVSRMVMFNLYFRDRLSFFDVFIHAMIQDGEGQKMSKSLGNGVDPLDIIHSHGSDAMRFTLTSMTTNTQDARLSVDTVCPFTQTAFSPKMIATRAGHRVAAPTQECPTDKAKKMVTSYGVASGEATPTADMPLARNTSSRFDYGRNFANKLWNAVRFALGNLDAVQGSSSSEAKADSLVDQWILSRLARTVGEVDRALSGYEFSSYAQGLYNFIWRDFCDWYIEAVKPTVRDDPGQRAVLATCLDVTLRLLHPVMPFITEKLWERLNTVVPERGVQGLSALPNDLLVCASWPQADDALVDEEAERRFALLQGVISAVREVRSTHRVPPSKRVTCSIRAVKEYTDELTAHSDLIGTLANVDLAEVGPAVEAPENAGSTVVGDLEIYLHDLVDKEAERERLERRIDDVKKREENLRRRLGSESYVSKAPPNLVRQTRDQLAEAEKELATLESQLKSL